MGNPPIEPRLLRLIVFMTRAKMTPQTETMLLTHMFALCLRVDDYATDTESIAHDLGMKPAT